MTKLSNQDNINIVQIKIPNNLIKKHVKRIANEYNTLYVQIKGIVSRTSLYDKDLDRTCFRLLKNNVWKHHDAELETVRDMVVPYIREHWLTLLNIT